MQSKTIHKLSALSFLILLVFPPVVCAADSSGADYFGNSRTYLRLEETVNNDRIAPLYEYLDVTFEDLAGKKISFQASGWFRADVGDKSGDEATDKDLTYAYFSYGGEKGDTLVNLGRLFVYEGAASEQIDGLYARTDLMGGLGVSLYGGIPVEADGDGRDRDTVYGARVSHRVPGVYSIGISYLKENNDAETFREEEGVDILVGPVKKVELQGRSSYNSDTSGWMEHAYYLTVGPFANIGINAEFTDIDYEHYFAATNVSVFDPFNLDPDESATSIGGGVEYRGSALKVAANYRNYDYEIAGGADYYGVDARYALAENASTGVSVHRMNGDTDELRYNEYRAYATAQFGKADATVDLHDTHFDEKRNDVSDAYSISAALGYNITKNSRIAGDVEYAKNPIFDKEFKTFIKYLYRFGTTGRAI